MLLAAPALLLICRQQSGYPRCAPTPNKASSSIGTGSGTSGLASLMTVVTVAPAFAAPDPPTNGGNGAGQNGQCTGSPDLGSALLMRFGMRYGQSGLPLARSHDLPEKDPSEVAIADKEEGSEY